MPEISLTKIESSDARYRELIVQLDRELAVTDGADHDFYHQFNGSENLAAIILVLDGKKAVGCGAIKPFDTDRCEVKRMFVISAYRGRGLAGKILTHLESLSQESGYRSCILETGVRQLPAIRLYEKCGYSRIENYGQYAGVVGSVCMEKRLSFT